MFGARSGESHGHGSWVTWRQANRLCWLTSSSCLVVWLMSLSYDGGIALWYFLDFQALFLTHETMTNKTTIIGATWILHRLQQSLSSCQVARLGVGGRISSLLHNRYLHYGCTSLKQQKTPHSMEYRPFAPKNRLVDSSMKGFACPCNKKARCVDGVGKRMAPLRSVCIPKQIGNKPPRKSTILFLDTFLESTNRAKRNLTEFCSVTGSLLGILSTAVHSDFYMQNFRSIELWIYLPLQPQARSTIWDEEFLPFISKCCGLCLLDIHNAFQQYYWQE